MHVWIVQLYVYTSQMHFAFDWHNQMEEIFGELVSYFNLKVKMY